MMTPFERKMIAAGLNQTDLAKKLDISQGAVSKWCRGDSMPEPSRFPKLAKIFGMTAEDVTHLFDPQPITS